MKVTPYDRGRAWYHHADGSNVLEATANGVTTTSRSFPLRYQVILGLGELAGGQQFKTFARVTLDVAIFGSQHAEDLRVAPHAVNVEVRDIERTPLPLPVDLLRSISVHNLTIEAMRLWCMNSDGSAVTAGQARLFMSGGKARLADNVEQRWRRASEAYLKAKASGKPTTDAVMREFDYQPTQKEAARQLVLRASKSGTLDAVARELDLSHFLTEGQRRGRPVES